MQKEILEIKRKILNKDFNFDFMEQEYIKANDELKKLFAQVLDEDEKLWNDKNFKLSMDFSLDINYFSEELKCQYLGFLVNKENIVANLEYDINTIKEILQNPENIQLVETLIDDKISNILANIKLGDKVDSSALEALLEKKEYTKISLLSYSNELRISENALAKIKANYPFAKLGFPDILMEHATEFLEEIPYMNLNSLGYLLQNIDPNKEYSIKVKVDHKYLELAKSTYLKKMLMPEEIAKTNQFREAISMTSSFMLNFNLNNLNEELIEKHNYLNFYNYIRMFDENTTQGLWAAVANDIRNNKNAYMTFRANIIYFYITKVPKEVLDIYLDNDDLEVILAIYDAAIRDEYLEKVIAKIEQGDAILKEKVTKLSDSVIDKYPILRKYAYEHDLREKIGIYFDYKDEELLNLHIEAFKKGKSLKKSFCVANDDAKMKMLAAIVSSTNIDNIMLKVYEIIPLICDNNSLLAPLKDKLITDIKNNDKLAVEFSKLTWVTFCAKKNIDQDVLDEIFYTVMSRNSLTAFKLLEHINHHEELNRLYNETTYHILRHYLVDAYDIDPEKLDYLVSLKGPKVLRFIENDSIRELLKLSKEEIVKVIALFPDMKYSLTDLEAGYDAIKQYEYGKNNAEVINIFPNIIHSIDDGNNNYQEYLKELLTVMDEKFYKKFGARYDLEDYQDPVKILELIVIKIKNVPEKRDKYIDVLHSITDYYIERKREEYRKCYNCYQDLNVPSYPLEKDKVDFIIKYLLQPASKTELTESQWLLVRGNFRKVCVDAGLKEDLFNDIISYINGHNDSITNSFNDVKKNIKPFKRLLASYITNDMKEPPEFYEAITKLGIQSGKIRLVYELPSQNLDDVNDFSFYEVLSKLRIDILKDKILSDEAKYQELMTIIKKRKAFILPDCLVSYMQEHTDLQYTKDNFIEFINYFYKIIELEEQRVGAINDKEGVMSLINVLKNSIVYAGSSSVYTLLLNPVDARLIAANAGPNAANRKIKNNERLNEAVSWTINNYKRQKLTVPPINTVLTLGDKKMQCIVGNFTSPCNLTHGERTGACMRIGGVGETLFDFALKNENGFHIRFLNPETGSYVSRVTGFRNGNTVFLNELRNSCDKTYKNSDIVDFCKCISKLLIEESKGSTLLIDNVVIARAYATLDMEEKETDLGVNNIKEGLSAFYSDVGSRAIVLATSNNGRLVPVDLDKSKVPIYPVCRNKIMSSTNLSDIISVMNRVSAVKNYLETGDLEKIEALNFLDGFIYGICNDDWYIYVDESYNIHSEIINIDKRALREYTLALEQMEKYVSEIKKGENYGR